MTPYFGYRYTAGIEETNLVGSVYFSQALLTFAVQAAQVDV